MTYKYGRLLIPKSNLGLYRVYPDKSVFVDYYAYWPDFAILERNKTYSPIDMINIMFEIELLDQSFKDMYTLKESYQERGKMLDIKPTGFDFSGLEGYRRYIGINFWYYVAVNPRVMTPQGTPLAISCSIIGYKNNISLAAGKCRFNLIFDEHLRAQIRFNMYLLRDWQEFYNKIITLISQFRQQGAKSKIQ